MQAGALVALDVGQSGTVGLVSDLAGHVLGQARGAGAERETTDAGRARTYSVISEVLQSCIAQAGDQPVVAAHFGLTAGARAVADLAPRLLPDAHVGSSGDILVATVSGIGLGSGVGILAGTGSGVAYVEAGRLVRLCGAWGGPLGDAGSGYSVGMAAIRTAIRMEDGRLPADAMLKTVLSHAGVASMREFATAFYSEAIPAGVIAGLVPAVLELDAQGESHARRIINEAAEGVCDLVCAAAQEGAGQAGLRVAMTGGLLAVDSRLRRRAIKRVQAKLPGAEIILPVVPPVAGSLILAAAAVGVADLDHFQATLRESVQQGKLGLTKGATS